jgi:CheY-like chemotaxis protein
MGLILTIQPDSIHAETLRGAIRERADAEVVCTRGAADALAVIDARVPDIILLDALMPVGDQERLTDYLRLLPAAKHVQVISIPFIAPGSDGNASAADRGDRRRDARWWFSALKKRSQAVETPWDPRAFASDVVEYLPHPGAAAENDREHARRLALERERRQQVRWSPLDLELASSIRLAGASADLVNVSSGGALILTDLRPDSRLERGWSETPRTQYILTLQTAAGEEIQRSGRAVRCHVKSLGQGRTLYEVAFRFEDSLEIEKHGLQQSA